MTVQHADKRGSATDHECHTKGSTEGTAIQQFKYRATANVER
jgi:hypothetical protein